MLKHQFSGSQGVCNLVKLTGENLHEEGCKQGRNFSHKMYVRKQIYTIIGIHEIFHPSAFYKYI